MGQLEKFFRMFCILFLMSTMVAGCSGSDDHISGSDDDETPLSTIPDYGGSIPKGDYITAVIEGDQVTIRNVTLDTEETFTFSDSDVFGSSIVKKTEADEDGSFYYMALVEGKVLCMQQVDSNGAPVGGALPFFMFGKESLSAENFKGRALNLMEFFADADATDSAAVEMGIVGFDTDSGGRLYGAALDSEGDGYSITDEDGEADSGDEFSLDQTEEQSDDGSLVLWEDGEDNWGAATTLTGTSMGIVVMDHGPDAGGGAGFAWPQVTESDADAFWATVVGDYFLIYYDDDGGVEFCKCVVAQAASGDWDGRVTIYSAENESHILRGPVAITPLYDDCREDVETFAQFDSAESTAVQDADLGKGLFQEDVSDPDFIMSFDPDGNSIGIVDLDTDLPAFGVAVRDSNWEESSSSNDDADHTSAKEFIAELIYYWNGVDFSYSAIDGYNDTDSDGEVDSNDAINFIETLKALGYDVPETSIDGIHSNYYTEAGYVQENEHLYSQVGFTYTEGSSVAEDDLKNADWTGLEIGDLIFIDYNQDNTWDNAAVYLGEYGGYTHAVFISSDYYDKSMIMNLDLESEIINLDIDYGYSEVRKPVFNSYPTD